MPELFVTYAQGLTDSAKILMKDRDRARSKLKASTLSIPQKGPNAKIQKTQ